MSSGAKDRLNDLLTRANEKNNQSAKIEIEQNGEASPEFQEVFEKVYIVRNMIDDIKRNTKKIKEIAQGSIFSKSIFTEIENLVKNTYDIAFKITEELKLLDVTNSKKNDKKTALYRMKRLQYASLRQSFQNELFANNEFIEELHERKRALLKKQALLVHSSLQDDELEKLLDNPESVQLFTDNILLETRTAKDELNQIEERHAELLKIENMLTDINVQFKRIAILVEQQKEHINRIEFHACDAINYVDKGLVDIQKAEKNKRKIRKKIYLISVCACVIIIILLLILIIN